MLFCFRQLIDHFNNDIRQHRDKISDEQLSQKILRKQYLMH